jgi:predicted O-linked N-acetylglucosamine transferase (SPINDLY family)
MLSYFRLGKTQYNTWGHSDTSGMPHIDYFVSSKYYELDYNESQKNYSEKLILQNGLCTCYVNPTEKYNFIKNRTFYGLSKYDTIILCPQSLFKIDPNFDEVIFKILFNNPNSTLVFVDALNRKEKMCERWNDKVKNKYKNVLRQIKFIGNLTHELFCNLISLSNIMIDPYPFGGCNTSLEGFSLDIPIVTRPSKMINGRFTYGFYKKMGFYDCVANTDEEYVNITTKLLKNQIFFENVKQKINSNKDILFNDQETLDEWEQLMLN